MLPISLFRFGIPLGSATVLAALLELGISSYWALNEFGSFFYFHLYDNRETVDYRGIIGVVAVFLRCVLTISLWVFVLLAHRGILLFWLPLSVIADFIILAHGVNNITRNSFVSDEIWFLNLAVILLLRLYITCVIYQTFHRLLKNAKIESDLKENEELGHEVDKDFELQDLTLEKLQDLNKNGTSPPNSPSSSSSPKYDIVDIGRNPLKSFSIGTSHEESKDQVENADDIIEPRQRFLLLEPIGESPEKIWEFYNYTPRLGAAILVIFELVWNTFTLGTHALTEFLMGGKIFFMIDAEEIFMRIWRIIIDLAALYFIFKRKKTLLRFWLIIHFWSLFASLCLYVFALAEGDSNPPHVTLMVSFTLFVGDNCLRFFILYFVLRTTTHPPLTTPTSDLSPTSSDPESDPGKRKLARSHSLKSQTRSRIRRISKAKRRYGKTMKMHRISGNYRISFGFAPEPVL